MTQQNNHGPQSPAKEGAKNLRASSIYIATYNIRRLLELEEELKEIKWDIIGLAETRRCGESIKKLASGNILYTNGKINKRQSGVGFLINKSLANNVTEFKSVSDRLAFIILKINTNYSVKIVQVYAPTTAYEDEEVEELYDELADIMDNKTTHYTIVMGDFNAKIGSRNQGEENVMGKFGFGTRNERGQRLIEFALGSKLFIANSKFKKNINRKWTWRNPDGTIKNEIDFIMSTDQSIIQDVSIINKVNTGSDHRLVRCKASFNTRLERIKLVKSKRKYINVEALRLNKQEFQITLRNRFEELQLEDCEVNTHCNKIVDTLFNVCKNTIGDSRKPVRESKLSEETKALLRKRREMKQQMKNHGIIEYTELCKTIRKKMREELRSHNTKIIRNAIDQGKGLKVAYMKIKEGRKIMASIKDKNGLLLTEKDKITERCAEFYQNLYSSSAQQIRIETNVQETVPYVMPDEVIHALKQMKDGKAPGKDELPIELIKEAGNETCQEIAKLFTKCLKNREVPEEWNMATIILLHKKGDKSEINNYRPISLTSHMCKLFTRVIKNRIEKQLDEHQPREQAGFRSGYSTTDHLQVLNQVIEKSNEYKEPLYIAFVDYEKAFDSVEHEDILNALEKHQIPTVYIETLASMYRNGTAQVKVDNNMSKPFDIRRGVRQGDTLSPNMFNSGLEQVFRRLNWQDKGININGEKLSNLRFADDVALLSRSLNELQDMINELQEESEKIGLKANMEKTKIIINSHATKGSIKMRGEELQIVDEVVYLGQQITMKSSRSGEIQRRISAGWIAFAKYRKILKSNIPICLKRKIYHGCIEPVITYGSQVWALNKRLVSKLRTTQRSMERAIIGVTKRDHLTNKKVRELSGTNDIISTIKKLKWSWAGHIARMKDNRWTQRTMEWIPIGQKRERARPMTRWDDEIIKFMGVTWIRKAQDRKLWKIHGEAFVQQWTDHG
jgi:endonuclease/exonuclease/phosphatase family metal-dependent hydrolase